MDIDFLIKYFLIKYGTNLIFSVLSSINFPKILNLVSQNLEET